MVILEKRENLIKGTQSSEYIFSIFFKDKMQVPTALLLFWITQGSPLNASPHLVQKYIAFSTIRNYVQKGMELRSFCLSVKHFVGNLKIPLINSAITLFKVLIISIAGFRIFFRWIETEPCNKSILLGI